VDAGRFLEWLQHAFRAGGAESGPRRILRFRRAADYERCLQALRSARLPPGLASQIRRLGIIRGLACPLPCNELPAAFRDALACEEDGKVRQFGAPKRVRVSPRRIRLAPSRRGPAPKRWSTGTAAASPVHDGIPWGVQRIRAPEVWNRTTGYGVRVAVIDTGVDFSHPDLRHSLQRGINLLHRTMPPYDDNGHGTHITGTIAAANRLQGMIGVAPRAQVFPVKAFDYDGTAYVSDIILAIDWCVRNRIQVINMSFGMDHRSQSLENAVTNAWRSGLLVVASAGNDGKRGAVDYPARSGYAIAVGALNRRGRVASFTNRSKQIDIYAPGERIYSSWPQGRRREMSGTSMATSHVTGAVALLLAYRPGLSPAQVLKVVKSSARPLRYRNAPKSAGALDVVRLLQAADALF